MVLETHLSHLCQQLLHSCTTQLCVAAGAPQQAQCRQAALEGVDLLTQPAVLQLQCSSSSACAQRGFNRRGSRGSGRRLLIERRPLKAPVMAQPISGTGEQVPRMFCALDKQDMQQLATGLKRCAQLLAAGQQ